MFGLTDAASRSLSAPIGAADAGIVTLVNFGYGGGYGNYVVITHGNGYSTLYAHLRDQEGGGPPGKLDRDRHAAAMHRHDRDLRRRGRARGLGFAASLQDQRRRCDEQRGA